MLIRPPLILDSDLLSCFCDADRMDILEHLYSGKMVILPHVIYEVSVVRKFKPIFEPSIKNNHISIVDMDPLGNDGQEFVNLRHRGRLGAGEAALISTQKAWEQDMPYIDYNLKRKPKLITTSLL